MKYITLAFVLLLLAAPVDAAQLQAKFAPLGPDVSAATLLGDGAAVRDVLPNIVACVQPLDPANSCVVFPLGPRGVTVTYTLRSCNSLGECAVSNGVPFRVPQVPVASTLSIEVIP